MELENKLLFLVKECKQELASIELDSKIPKEISFNINFKAKNFLGVCRNKKKIEITSWLLTYGTDKQIKNTIMHEIIHTFKDTVGHQKSWKRYAQTINTKLGYSISVRSSIREIYNEANAQDDYFKRYRYKIVCKKCGKTMYYMRLKKYYFYNQMRHTSCGGNDFEIYDLKTNTKLK